MFCAILSACSSLNYIETSDASRHLATSKAIIDDTHVVRHTSAQTSTSSQSVTPQELTASEVEEILALFAKDKAPVSPPEYEIKKIIEPPVARINQRDLDCLTRVMYFEARGEGRKGMLAVGHVVMNRVADDRFPDNICGVVKQGKHHSNGLPVKHMCQFSWYCDGIPDKVYDKDTYEEAATLAKSILTGSSVNPVSRSLYFHTTAVRPKWSRVFARTARVGNHIFYYA